VSVNYLKLYECEWYTYNSRRSFSTTEQQRQQKKSIPPEVFESFNELIVKDFNGTSSTVRQNDVVALIANKLKIDRQSVFSSRWLDVETEYAKSGWDVEYDKPGYNETYEPTFTFKKRKTV
jgi:hypothetical protein